MSLLMHRNCKDETGKVYGRLTVIRRDGKIDGAVAWYCKCSCGNETIRRGNLLRRGTVRSCGCLALEVQKNTGRKNQKFGSDKIRKYPQPSANWLGGLMNRHKISPRTWTKLILMSEGRCDICLEQFKNTAQHLNVDHDHETGIVRGLLCSRCNGMLAGLEDKKFCIKATLYLQKGR